jgi:hypothetical protein
MKTASGKIKPREVDTAMLINKDAHELSFSKQENDTGFKSSDNRVPISNTGPTSFVSSKDPLKKNNCALVDFSSYFLQTNTSGLSGYQISNDQFAPSSNCNKVPMI